MFFSSFFRRLKWVFKKISLNKVLIKILFPKVRTSYENNFQLFHFRLATVIYCKICIAHFDVPIFLMHQWKQLCYLFMHQIAVTLVGGETLAWNILGWIRLQLWQTLWHEISNGAGPGSAPLASAIFKEENCNHGQKMAFLVWAYNLGPQVEQMYAFFKPQPQTMKDREKTETPSLLVGGPAKLAVSPARF